MRRDADRVKAAWKGERRSAGGLVLNRANYLKEANVFERGNTSSFSPYIFQIFWISWQNFELIRPIRTVKAEREFEFRRASINLILELFILIWKRI